GRGHPTLTRRAPAQPGESGHPIIRSAEPGEDWSWCYIDEIAFAAVPPSQNTEGPGRRNPRAARGRKALDVALPREPPQRKVAPDRRQVERAQALRERNGE